mmetsp:Transcript_107542/g.343001  ORF Transcript_107542/g.343001 Transcript_107542/m.343001 type:complete len:217 (-) Transcript_107542:4562-5212(-)
MRNIKLATRGSSPGHNLINFFCGSTHYNHLGTIYCRNRDLVRVGPLDSLRDISLRSKNRCHGTGIRCTMLCDGRTAGCNQAQTLLQWHSPNDDSSTILADAVPQDSAWLNAPRSPKLRERVLHCEDSRLGELGLINATALLFSKGVHQFEQRYRQQLVQDLCAPIHSIPEDKLLIVKLSPHANILRALSCEQKGDPLDLRFRCSNKGCFLFQLQGM